MKMEIRKDEIMGRVLTEGEKEKQAITIGVSTELMKNLLGNDKINTYDFGRKYMYLKYYDYEQTKEIQGNLSNEELEKFPSMGLDMGVFKNNQNEYISVYDIADIKIKSTEMTKDGLNETIQDLEKGNCEVENSDNRIDSLKVYFNGAKDFYRKILYLREKKRLSFLIN